MALLNDNNRTEQSTDPEDEGTDGPIPVEPDGGIGDGAGPPGEDLGEGPFPVEPDGGIGDGAGPLPGDGPFPVEPDGGIGDGAGPPGEDLGEGPFPVEPDGGIGDGAGPPPGDGPFPVEPDGGIGDGAGPLPGLGPIPVEPDGGIGDGAGPLRVLVSNEAPSGAMAIALDEAETFYFVDDGGNAAVFNFDIETDALDLSQTAFDFTDLSDVLDASRELVNLVTGEVSGVLIDLGDGQTGFVAGIDLSDLGEMDIIV